MIICQPSDRRSSSGCDKTPVKASTHGAVPSPRHDHTATGPSSPRGLHKLWAGGGAHSIMAVDGRGEGTVAVDRGGWNGREVWGVVGGPRAT
ncbi:hypothetical protein BHE74_00008597 [Ensete ventricosum]|nr:hypothetical protein BHE74_00008597 [Ensete ventricosum]